MVCTPIVCTNSNVHLWYAPIVCTPMLSTPVVCTPMVCPPMACTHGGILRVYLRYINWFKNYAFLYIFFVFEQCKYFKSFNHCELQDRSTFDLVFCVFLALAVNKVWEAKPQNSFFIEKCCGDLFWSLEPDFRVNTLKIFFSKLGHRLQFEMKNKKKMSK